MPLYEYKCDSCGATFEVIQRLSDPPVEQCRVCGGPVHKVLSAPAIQFKGSGWYVTDYAKKGMTEASKSKPSNGASPSATSSDSSKPASESSTPASTSSPASAAKKD